MAHGPRTPAGYSLQFQCTVQSLKKGRIPRFKSQTDESEDKSNPGTSWTNQILANTGTVS